MKKTMKTVALTSLFALTITMVQADPFINPPENNYPGWVTTFPYQRNIDLGFGVYPVSSPGNGIPGAIYEGGLDPGLLYSDHITLSGDVGWFTGLSGISRTGLIGIDNRLGNTTLTGTAVIRLDNVPFNNTEKHWYDEVQWFENNPSSDLTVTVSAPPGYISTYLNEINQTTFPDGFMQSNLEYLIAPNPPFEFVNLQFTAAPGSYVVVDEFHIATECVPEPAAFSLLALGGLALLWRKRS